MMLPTWVVEVLDFLVIAGGLIWIFSMLLLMRTSMKTIERKMLAEGIDIPWWDQKGWGLRISMFILILTRGSAAKVSLLDNEAILRHSRVYDRVLARVVSFSFLMFMLPAAYFVFVKGL